MSSASHVAHAVAALGAALPPGRCSTDAADLFAVSQDLWPRNVLRLYHGRAAVLPAAVVWPQSTLEVQQIVCWALEHRIALVPYGGGSGVVGGTTVGALQVVVDMKRMHRLVTVDADGLVFTAESGIMGELLERQLQRAGFSQGHFPSSIYCSTLGGWLATRSAGQASCRYGKIEDQVVGGVAVLGDGSIVEQSARPTLSPTFCALTGNEGVLGIWTQATVRMHPLPEHRAFLAFDFPDLARALDATRAMLLEGLSPSVLRIYDPLDSLLHRDTHSRREHRDRGPSWSAAVGAYWPQLVGGVGERIAKQCRCIAIYEGATAWVTYAAARMEAIARGHGAQARGPQPAQAWYDKRYAVSYKMSNVFRAGVAVDTMEVACQWHQIIPVYHAVKRAGLRCGAQVLAHFSHLYSEGGSIYFTYAFPASRGESAYDTLWEVVLSAAMENGANVSHHHGVGQLKSAALQRLYGDGGAALHAQRRAFDPQRVLNPATLAMHRATRPPLPKADAPCDRQTRMARVDPTDTLAAVEARLAHLDQTLGAAAALFGQMTVLAAARAELLWRVNPQLDIVESLLMGVDAAIGRAEHLFTPAPRAAQGPDLRHELLQHAVQQLWLRTEALPAPQAWRATVAWNEGVRVAQHISQHAMAHGLMVSLAGMDAQAVQVTVQSRHPHPEHAALVLDMLPHAEATAHFHGEPWPSVAKATRISLAWAELRACLATMATLPRIAIPWIDSVGGVVIVGWEDDAFQMPSTLAPYTHEVTHTPPLSRTPCQAPTAGPPLAVAAALGWALPPDHPKRAALDNCTYCPKLCRFSCPVPSATGNEATIPRQMMLVTRLDVARQRALSPEAARTLYSCVDCRGCRTFCDHDNDVATALIHTRQDLWQTELVPRPVRQVCEHLSSTGAMPAVDPTARLATAGVPGSRTTLFFGCQNHGASQSAMEAAHALAQQTHGGVRIAYGSGHCCGHALYRWGARDAFAAHARAFAKGLPPGTVDLIVDDPGCAYAFDTLYRQVADVAMPQVHWVPDLLPRVGWTDALHDYALHDACFGTRWLGRPPLRQILALKKHAPGSILEGEAGCCGGMLLPFFDADVAVQVARARVADVQAGAGHRIVSPSPTCSRRLRHVHAPVDDLVAVWFARRGEATAR